MTGVETTRSSSLEFSGMTEAVNVTDAAMPLRSFAVSPDPTSTAKPQSLSVSLTSAENARYWSPAYSETVADSVTNGPA